MIDLIGKKVKYKQFAGYNNHEEKIGELVCFGTKSRLAFGDESLYTSAVILLPDGTFTERDVSDISLVMPSES